MERHENEATACSVCQGHVGLERHHGIRCWGYSTEKTVWCTQVESASWDDDASAYMHRRSGACDCGQKHSTGGVLVSTSTPLSDAAGSPVTDAKPEAVYVYTTVTGTPLYRVLRFSDPKEFRQQRYDRQTGEWVWGLGKGEQKPPAVLYHLGEVAFAVREGYPIWLCEGEKDADRLREMLEGGAVATCNHGGSGGWRAAHAELLRGAKQIHVIRDRDEPGRKWSRKVWDSLQDDDEACDVKIWEVPLDEEGADFSDMAEAGVGLEKLVLVFPTPAKIQAYAIRAPSTQPKVLRRIDIEKAPKMPALGWPSDIPRFAEFSGLTILAGQSGSAKSTIAIASSLQAARQGIEAMYITSELSAFLMWERIRKYLGESELPSSWGFYMPQQHEPFDNVIDAIEERCTGAPVLVVIDSINTLVANEQPPSEADTYQLGIVSERMMWARNAVTRAKGLLGILMVSESSAAGQMKGRFGFRADIEVTLEKDPKTYTLIRITVNKNWGGFSGPLGQYELHLDTGRLAWMPESEEKEAW